MVYRVIKFEMIDGTTFYVWEDMPGIKEIKDGKRSKFMYEDGRTADFPSWQILTSDLTQFPVSKLYNTKVEFLPYTADVIEDLPSSVQGKFPPAEYKGCKLLPHKHNGYMEFYHEPTGKTLRIAMNSNYYKPEKPAK